jgi:hypothetical protein
MSIPIHSALDYLRNEHDVPASIVHTGGGNYVVGIGAYHGYDEEQGCDVFTVNLGPVYRDDWHGPAPYTGEAGDLYLVSASPSRADVTVHTEGQLLPTILSMLGIDDVNVDDPTLSLDDIATEIGDPWFLAGIGGNTQAVCRDDGTMITIDSGQGISFLPAPIIVGRQGPNDDEWRELWSGSVWSAAEVADIVADHA